MESRDMMAKDDKQDLTEIKVVRKTVRKKEEPKKPTKQKPNDDERILSNLRDRQHTYQQSVIHNPDRFSFIKDEPKRARAIRWYRSYLEKRYMLTNKLSPIRFLPTTLQIKWYRIDPQLRHRLLKGLLIAIVILLMGIGIYNNSQQERIEAEREQEERLLREQEIEEIREQTRQEAEERLEEQRQREQENKVRVDELQEELDRLEAIDSYEEFYDGYIEFLESYDATDLTMLTKYFEWIKDLDEMEEFFEEIEDWDLTLAEYDYYIDTSIRILEKLSKIE